MKKTAVPVPLRAVVAGMASVVALAAASTLVLYLQTRKSADDALQARALDRATGLALAQRSMALDDGVLGRLTRELEGNGVLTAAVLTQAGEAVAGTQTRGLERELLAVRAAQVFESGSWKSFEQSDLFGISHFELWYPLATAQPNPVVRPGPPDSGPRLLVLLIDPASARRAVQQVVAHAAMLAGLMAVLVALVLRQLRQTAQLRQLDAQRASERRFLELGRLSGVLAHEVRNPLGAIKGFAQLTAARFASDDPAHGDMQVIVDESARLERLVHALLQYAKPLELQLESQDLAELLRQAARKLQADWPGELAVRVPDAPVVCAVDRDAVAQALGNLLRNAAEASEPGGVVELELTRDRGGICIAVQDEGPGIAAGQRTEIFEPYVTTKATGTGIGLAITRRIAEAHGGTLQAVDRPDGHGGARLEWRIPLIRKEEV